MADSFSQQRNIFVVSYAINSFARDLNAWAKLFVYAIVECVIGKYTKKENVRSGGVSLRNPQAVPPLPFDQIPGGGDLTREDPTKDLLGFTRSAQPTQLSQNVRCVNARPDPISP